MEKAGTYLLGQAFFRAVGAPLAISRRYLALRGRGPGFEQQSPLSTLFSPGSPEEERAARIHRRERQIEQGLANQTAQSAAEAQALAAHHTTLVNDLDEASLEIGTALEDYYCSLDLHSHEVQGSPFPSVTGGSLRRLLRRSTSARSTLKGFEVVAVAAHNASLSPETSHHYEFQLETVQLEEMTLLRNAVLSFLSALRDGNSSDQAIANHQAWTTFPRNLDQHQLFIQSRIFHQAIFGALIAHFDGSLQAQS
ncbi:hypothetical protein T439DRAFT_384505 [Meredithblackwellia eburnea MCA 4105]